MEASRRFQVGVVGYGMSATVFHIPFILDSPKFNLYAIVQQDGDSAKTDHPTVEFYKNADDLFANPVVDLVVLSTPPPTHFGLGTKALNAGKNVVVEKPFAPTTSECDTLIALAHSKNLFLVPFQNRRWDIDFLTLQSILHQLGRVVEFESHMDRYDPEVPTTWAGKVQPGSGVIYDLGAHLFDQVLVLYGMPDRVTGFLAAQKRGTNGEGKGVMDACTVLLHYGNGLLVTVKASALSAHAYEEQLRFWVRGDLGSYKKYYMDPQALQIMGDGMKLSDPQFGIEDSSLAGSLTVYRNGKLVKTAVPNLHPPPTYRKFYEILATALEGKGEAPVTPESTRDAIRLIELATKSSQEGVTLAVE